MPRKDFKLLAGVFSDLAHRKARAAIARKEKVSRDREEPRSIYLSACADIASEFLEDGFRYAKSGPHLTRKGSPFSFKISFGSSHHNVPGEHVALGLAGMVMSAPLKAWRARQPRTYRKDDCVAGGLAHRLGTNLAYIGWDLADPADRPETIADVKRFVREVVLAYFARFSTPGTVIEELMTKDIPAMNLASAIEFALCFGSTADAQSILDRFFVERPELLAPAVEAAAKFREQGTPDHFLTGYANEAALMVIVHGLSLKAR